MSCECPSSSTASSATGRTRAELRRGGPTRLAAAIEAKNSRPTSGPAGCTRPPAPAGRRPPPAGRLQRRSRPAGHPRHRREIAGRIREGGPEGLPGVRAIGLWLEHRGVAQVSTNVEDHRADAAGRARGSDRRARPAARAELVGLGAPGRLRRIPARTSRVAEPPDDRRRWPRGEVSSIKHMAQTKRKRRTKHRGTAAGTIEARGRTGRPPSPEEKKKQSRMDARERRLNTPPTWKSSLMRAGAWPGPHFRLHRCHGEGRTGWPPARLRRGRPR